MAYKYQPYPKRVYRGDPENLESKLVKDETEHEAAKLEGFGPHPSTVKAAAPPPPPEPPLEPAVEPIVLEAAEQPKRGPGRPPFRR